MINSTHTKISTIAELLRLCFSKNIPFVSYSLPNEENVTTLIQYKTAVHKVNNFSGFNKWKGFLFTPFEIGRNSFGFLLEPDVILTTLSVPEDLLTKLSEIAPLQTQDNHKNPNLLSTDKEEFIKQVELIKHEIELGFYDKIVLSRVLIEPLKKDYDAASFYEMIYSKYPSTLRYIVNIPEIGCWMGATPEPLIEKEEDTINITALAGTKKMNGELVEDITWSTKEIIEQRYVTQFIDSTLNKFHISDYSLQGPFNNRASNVVHLRSVFSLKSKKIANHLGDFITDLHPTPSIAGIPKKNAIEFIRKQEKHEREFYTGLLGPVNINNQTRLFVNLRCMKLIQNYSFLYAGAGITSGSEPNKEWEETNQKLYAMHSIIKGL